MSEKTTLLSEAETELTLFKRAIAGLDEARMRQVWLGTWSARDIVAHISGWHRELSPALERIARGERPIAEGVSYEDVDAWNGRFADAKKTAATADILAELDASHAAFMRAAATVPDERYVPGKTAHKIVDLNSRHHYQEHRSADRGLAQGRLVARDTLGGPGRARPPLLPLLLPPGGAGGGGGRSDGGLRGLRGHPGRAVRDLSRTASQPWRCPAAASPISWARAARSTLGGLSMSAGSVLFGLAPGFGVAFAGRLLVGLGASVILIAGLRLAVGVVRHRGVRHRRGRGPERGLDRRARGHHAARPAGRADRLAPGLRRHRRGHRAAGRRVLPHRARPAGAPGRAGVRAARGGAGAARDHRGDPERARQSPLVDGGPHLGRHLRRLRRLRGPLGRAVSHAGLRAAARAGRQPGRAGRAGPPGGRAADRLALRPPEASPTPPDHGQRPQRLHLARPRRARRRPSRPVSCRSSASSSAWARAWWCWSSRPSARSTTRATWAWRWASTTCPRSCPSASRSG